MLAMIQTQPYDLIDTKWFAFEHQGNLGKLRFLWSDSLNVVEKEQIPLCVTITEWILI